MKIYLAYRSAYFPNSRFIKEFDEESILIWFQKYWRVFTKEEIDEDNEYREILGTDIYGFPFWKDEEPIPQKPKNFAELKTVIEKYIYHREIIGDENCLNVLTDDDEIELSWFIFTEEYRKENIEDLSLWFVEEIPTEFGQIGLKLNVEKEILPKGNWEGSVYFISCPIYYGSNLIDLEGPYKIENIRLPDFLNHLLTNQLSLKNEKEYSYTLHEVKFLKHIVKISRKESLNDVLEIFRKRPFTELHNEDYQYLSFEELMKIDLRNEDGKSKMNYSEHFCEICINSIGDFYNYWVIFDDLWIEKNQALAKSIVKFGNSWKLK